MDHKSDDFLKALLCLDINTLNLRVLIYWCSNPYDETPIEKTIARGLSIHEEKVEKAFKSLLSKGILEINGLSSSGNIRYAISRQTAE